MKLKNSKNQRSGIVAKKRPVSWRGAELACAGWCASSRVPFQPQARVKSICPSMVLSQTTLPTLLSEILLNIKQK